MNTIHYSPDCIGKQWFDGPPSDGELLAKVVEQYDPRAGESAWYWMYDDNVGDCESPADARKAVESAHAMALEIADEQAEQEARDAGPDALRTYMNEREREET